MANLIRKLRPEEIKQVRNDAIIATGRSDYNNQINYVMGFSLYF